MMKRGVLPGLILVAGLAVTTMLFVISPKTQRAVEPPDPRPVEIIEVFPSAMPIKISATGNVEAAISVNLIPEVTGGIVWRSKKLGAGGRFQKGETLARIDPREYELAVAQERARVRSAELELELEKSRGEIAAREWQLLKGNETSNNKLALRKSQLDAAEIQVAASKSGLARAQLNLERTSLRAPFNASVIDENLDIGQRVGPNQSVARLIGTDEFWVRVGIGVEELGSIAIPDVNAENGSQVRIVQRLADGSFVKRTGTVLRLIEELEPQTRRAQLIIAVRNPLDPGTTGIPLLPGSFVTVEIQGRELPRVAPIPPEALYDGETIWLEHDGTIQPLNVKVRFSSSETLYVVGDLPPKLRLVSSRLSSPFAGMAVRPVGGDPGTQQTPIRSNRNGNEE